MDKWTEEQLHVMKVGGNGNAKLFFEQKGWTPKDSSSGVCASSRRVLWLALYRSGAARPTVVVVTDCPNLDGHADRREVHMPRREDVQAGVPVAALPVCCVRLTLAACAVRRCRRRPC